MKLANITSVYRSTLIIDTFGKWIKPKSRVLDIGCGTGVVADELQKYFNLKINGCDVDSYLLRNIPFKKMVSPNRLPFKNKEFDISMFNDVLHHTEYANQEKLLKEALRVSRIVLLFELVPTVSGKIGDYVINKIHNPNMDIPFTYRSVDEWIKLFNKNNLKSEMKFARKPLLYPFTHVGFKLENG